MRRRGPLGEDADVNKAWGRPIPAPPPPGSPRPLRPQTTRGLARGRGLPAVSGQISRDQGQPRRCRKFGASGEGVRGWLAVAGGGGGAGTEDAALTRRAGRLSVAQVWNGASGCRRAGSMEAKGSRSEPDRPWEGVPGGLANLKEPARMVKWKLLN